MRLALLLAVLLVGPSPLFAHRLHVEVKLAGDRLRVEAYYDDDTPAQDAKVTVRSGDAMAAEGRTDDKGVWTCPRPEPGTYTVRAESAGHAATEPLTVPAPDPATAEQPPPAPTERIERTRTPWGRLAVGLGVIGALWLMWRAASRKPASVSPPAIPRYPSGPGGAGRGAGG